MPKSKYWIEPSAATFLADHGFDFNSQIQYGVRFTPGFTYPEHEPISENDAEKAAVETTPSTTGNKRRKKMIANGRGDPPNSGGSLYFQDDAIDSKHSLRELFRLLMTKKVVVHNGFLDVIYLYHALYAPLPPTLSTFIADLCEIFARKFIGITFWVTCFAYGIRRLGVSHCAMCTHSKAPHAFISTMTIILYQFVYITPCKQY